MKNYPVFIAAASMLMFCLSACKKEQPISAYKLYYKYGRTTVKINGTDFSSQTCISNNDSSFPGIYIANVKFNSAGEETPVWKLAIYNTKKILGRQSIYQPDYTNGVPTISHAGLYHYDGGWDASCGDYQTIDADSSSNYIEITDQKDNYHEIWGRFNVTVYIARQCRYNPMPDTIRFTEGSFHLFPPDKK